MREIDLEAPLTRVTLLLYGPLRTGKTRFAAGFPRPLFLADQTEGGYATIKSIWKRNPEVLYEPQRKPLVWAVETAADLNGAIPKIEPLVRSGEVQTIVIDSLTFNADLYLVHLKQKGAKDPRQLYGMLQDYLNYIRTLYHAFPVNVIWTALVKPPSEDNPIGAPLIAGSSALKFGGACDYVFYHRTLNAPNGGGLQYEIRTRAFGLYQAGGRDEGQLPDPLGYWACAQDDESQTWLEPDCSYRTFAEHINLTPPKVGLHKNFQALRINPEATALVTKPK